MLVNFKRYQDAGIKLDAGVLLLGPSRTGKTMTARYIATKSKARFIDIRQFAEYAIRIVGDDMHVHAWSDADIRNLFRFSEELAKKSRKPLVLFFDQIDDWLKAHQNVIAQLETEIDGFSGRKEGVCKG